MPRPGDKRGAKPARSGGSSRAKELAAAERAAWDTYTASTRHLTGAAYDEAEAVSWARLQRDLADIPGRVPDEPAPSAA